MIVDEDTDAYETVVRSAEDIRPMSVLAAAVARVPMATVNILTERKQYQVAAVGFEASVCDREDSMCRYTIDRALPVAVSDASVDPRFERNPFVTGELGQVRFYASFPLELRSGSVIGSLCVFDTEPREIDDDQVSHLGTLAGRIVDVFELSRHAQGLETALRDNSRLTQELRRSNASLAAFAGDVSHDLANPLSTVELALSMLRQDAESTGAASADAARWTSTGERATEAMRGIIGDFLQFARMGGAGDQTPVDLRAIVAAAAERAGFAEAGFTLAAGDLPRVVAHEGQLTAVVQNLLSNAIKFSRPPADVSVSAHRQGDFWCVEVADRGRGIEPGDASRLFEPLVRGAHDDVGGSGIGLSICRRIVEAHGGTIGLRLRDGGGTVAWFTIPAR